MGGPRTGLRRTVRITVGVGAVVLVAWTGWLGWLAFQARRSWNEAQEAFQAGRYATALDAATAVLRTRPTALEASLLAARCLMRLGRIAEAEDYFRRAGQLALEDQRARAQALLEHGQIDRAIPVLLEVLRLDPDDPDAVRSMAAIHQARGEYALAEVLAKRLIQSPAGELVGQGLLGTIYHDMADRGKSSPLAAIQALERVLELDPELVRCPIQPKRLFWEFLARDLLAEGRTAEARKHLTKALASGEDAGLLELLGRTHWSEGQLDQAERCWQRALELDPSLSDTWIELGQLALRKDRAAEAVRYLTRASELSPNSVNPLYKLIQAHRRLGQHNEADAIQQRLDALRREGSDKTAAARGP
jgi:tetratricopeptide (TPR) repeat protein